MVNLGRHTNVRIQTFGGGDMNRDIRVLTALAFLAAFTPACQQDKTDPARRVPYDNSDSGLEATTVQMAIDELRAQVAALDAELTATQIDLAATNTALASTQ